MRFINHERSRVAYRIGNKGMEYDHAVEPGLNEVDDHVGHALMGEPSFRRHAARGFITVLDNDGNPVPGPKLDEPVDPNARKPEPMPLTKVHRVVHPKVNAPIDQASMPNRDAPGLDTTTTPQVVTDSGVKPLADVAAPDAAADSAFLAMWATLDGPSREALLPTLDAHQQELAASAPAPVGA